MSVSPRIDTQVVLAGGAGTRMTPGGGAIAKHALEVGGVPLMLSAAPRFIRDFGIRHCVYRVAHRADDFVRRWAQGEFPLAVRSSVLVGHPSDGPIGALVECCLLLRGESLLITGGDVFYAVPGFADVLAFHRSHSAGLTVCAAPGAPARRPSVLTVDAGGTLDSFRRPDRSSDADLLNASVYVVDPGRISWLVAEYTAWRETHPDREFKEDQLWQLIAGRPDRARVFQLQGRLVNVNEPADLESAREAAATFVTEDTPVQWRARGVHPECETR